MRLAFKLPIVVIGAMLLTALAGGALSIVIGRHILRQAALEENVWQVETYASAVQFYIGSARSVLSTTAELPELRNQSRPRKVAALLLAHTDVFDYVTLLALDGTVVMQEPSALEEQLSHRNLSFSAWFDEVRRKDRTVVSDLHISPATQRPTIVIATPVRAADGGTLGIWAGALRLNELSAIGLGTSGRSVPRGSAYLTDRRGLVVAHQTRPSYVKNQTDFSTVPSVRAALAGQQGSSEIFNPIQNEEMLAAYRPLPELGWAVVNDVPAVTALAPLDTLTRGIMSASAALAALIGVAAFVLTRRIVAPLARLSAAARSVSKGDFGKRIEAPGSDEIGQLAVEFNRMASALAEEAGEVRKRTTELQAANQELESFSYSVSHDLRVPLRAVDGFSHMLEARHGDRLDADGRRLVGVVRANAQKMATLIDDILAFSRMGRKEMNLSEVDMAALARSAAEELAPLHADRDLQLRIAELPRASGDAAMLRQVWSNLLGNAFKFTRPKPAAHVEVGGYRDGEDNVYFVKDDGVGFDMEYAHKLFGVFQRLHGVDEFEGTGIGLAIVKRVVTRHGGRVWAQGKVNSGASVYFALPAVQGEAGSGNTVKRPELEAST